MQDFIKFWGGPIVLFRVAQYGNQIYTISYFKGTFIMFQAFVVFLIVFN